MNIKLFNWPIKLNRKWLVVIIAVVSVAAFGAWQTPTAHTETIAVSTLEVAAVVEAPFREQISIRGTYVPDQSVYLDAIEGGRVEQLLVEEGQLVTKGQPLLVLSNTSLQLDVISREAQISEQLNNLQDTRLAIQQNALSLKQELANYDYQIKKLQRKNKQNKVLLGKHLISEDEYQQVADELNYLLVARELTIESQKVDNEQRKIQLVQLEDSVEQLNKNLKFARKNLDNLVVKAPIDGQLSSLNAELGESKAQGERLGQVDNLAAFKVESSIDEFYLNNVYVGLSGTAYINNSAVQVSVDKIYSQVENGKFKIELKFEQPLTEKLRRGQNLTVALNLSNEAEVLQLPLGGFIQDSGGQWAFVVSADGKTAQRRAITLGRENGTQVEVVSGLAAGESVIVSPYKEFNNATVINFNFDS
ncbi:efflux RND transporter periplasmic adaptor subunit [Shewanella sp. C32]|uniref:Efflux RND transporter periplasmic adaptor subunit n=1 Tax=Shewanella electrica TaxID=515560 RepID=A0ABT2FSL4_9GAMM|nr:efflux RND transporter periplasmic adaptor subunit [Shewanella electrica]MCH1926593.1 efflux RND transporter periplasmic adaptor subunit [Shewanella electrica]MCS4558214.1 efflux RND transporter periplasmic adaptor subunit [Shewanella electrica]